MMAPALLLALLATQTEAPAKEVFASKVAEGLALYKQRDYSAAAKAFEAAFAIEPEPNLMFNAARCYEKMPDVDLAIERYETFLKLGGTTAEQRTKARTNLNALHAEQAAANVVTASPPPPAVVAQSNAPPPMVVAASPKPEGPSRVLEASLAGVGVAALIAGTVFGVIAKGSESKYRNALTEADRMDIESTGNRNALIADIGFATGIGALATAAVLYFVRGNDSEAVSNP